MHLYRSGHLPVPVSPLPAGGWELRGVGGVELLVCTPIEAAGADVVVTGRRGGVSRGPYRSLNLGLHVGDDPEAVLENRRRAVRALGGRLADLVVGAQVHGAGVAKVTDADRGRGATVLDDALCDVDALVVDRPGPLLATLAADCVPVAMFDPAAGVLGTVHAGWRGVTAGVVSSALAAMGSLGARPRRMLVGIGPAVSSRTYQIDDAVAEAVRARLADAPVLRPDGPGHWLLDLPAAVRLLLERQGVPATAVHVAAATTGAGGPFFSDRQARPCGRFALLARLQR